MGLLQREERVQEEKGRRAEEKGKECERGGRKGRAEKEGKNGKEVEFPTSSILL